MKAANWAVMGLTVLAIAIGTLPAAAKSNPERIREKAEEYTNNWLEADYKHRMEGKEAKYDRVAKDFAYLFSESKITDLQDEKAKASGVDEIRALQLLSNFIEAQIVVGKISGNIDDVSNYVLEEQAELPSGTMPMRQVRALTFQEPDRKVRKLAYVTVADKNTIVNVYRNQIIATILDAIAPLGYTSFADMQAKHQDIDYDKLKAFCEQLLAETASAYEQGLEEQAERVLDVGFSKVRRYDLAFLTLSTEMDGVLGKQKSEKIWKQLQKSLDLPRWQKKTVVWDFNDDENRVAHDDFFPIEFHKQLIVAGRERGATANLAGQLSAYGRLQRTACLATDQWEFLRVATRPLDLAAGYLFEGLLAEPEFATDMLGLSPDQATALERSRQFAELMQLRLDAATFLFELILHEDFKMAQPKFNEFMEQHLKVKHLTIDSEFYLDDFDFAVAERLVARKLASQIRSALQTRFGEKWWTMPEAGDFLETLWADGSRQSHEQLSATYGFTLYDTSTLVADLIAASGS